MRLPAGRSQHRYRPRPPDLVTPPIGADPPASCRWQAPPRPVTSRRTTVIAAMGESSARRAGNCFGPTVGTLPRAKHMAFLANESIGRT
jgi:hypothetical protein